MNSNDFRKEFDIFLNECRDLSLNDFIDFLASSSDKCPDIFREEVLGRAQTMRDMLVKDGVEKIADEVTFGELIDAICSEDPDFLDDAIDDVYDDLIDGGVI